MDSYCALIEKRPYRDAFSPEEAIQTILEDSNNKWNEKLATEFANVLKQDLI